MKKKIAFAELSRFGIDKNDKFDNWQLVKNVKLRYFFEVIQTCATTKLNWCVSWIL